jgi:hypothetical protein
MPVSKNTKKPKDAKALKKKLVEKAEAKDYKGIPPIVQEDVSTRKYWRDVADHHV